MELPSQEILIFTKQIRHWILSDQVISGKRKLFFREDTPKEILDLYENIKSKLDFAYQEVHSNNGLKNMKNRIIDVFKVVNRILVITVENPDFEALRVNQFVKIGDKKYRVRSVPMIHSIPPQSVLNRDTFTIDYTDDELLDKEAVFTTH